MNKKIKGALAAAVFSFSAMSGIGIAADGPIELTADSIEYNAVSDTAIAAGGVTVTRDGGVLKGQQATYDFKSQQVVITGGVTANKDDMSLKADKLVSTVNSDMTATGNVVVTKGENILNAPEIHYNQATSDINMPYGGSADGPQAAIRGNVMSGNLMTNQYQAQGDVYLNSKTNDVQSTSDTATYVGNGQDFNFTADGNVNLRSDSRNMTGHSDHAVYNSADNGKLVMTGNASATQNGNIVRGNTLTVYMGDNVKVQ